MNEELKKKLLESLTLIQKGIEGAWDFGKQEVPEVIKEYLTYNFYNHLIWGLLDLTLVVLTVYGVYKSFQSLKDDPKGLDACMGPLVIFSILAGITPAYFTLNHINEMVKIKVAPRVYLLEEVKELIRENR